MRMKWTILIVFCGIVGCQRAESPTACDVDSDCVAIRRMCITVAVHRDYEADKREELSHIRPDCGRPENGVWLPVRGVCRAGQCEVIEVED